MKIRCPYSACTGESIGWKGIEMIEPGNLEMVAGALTRLSDAAAKQYQKGNKLDQRCSVSLKRIQLPVRKGLSSLLFFRTL